MDIKHEESIKKSSKEEALSRENSRLQTQISHLKSKHMDQSIEYDSITKKLQQDIESQRRNHEREVRELRRDLDEQRKKRESECTMIDWNWII